MLELSTVLNSLVNHIKNKDPHARKQTS